MIDGHPKLVTFCQPQLETALRRRLSQYPNVDVQLGVALENFVDEGNCVEVMLRHGDGLRPVRTRYLIGADGAGSLVRRSHR
ncbi:FAD-dependent monooxygenase [Dyella sp. EPa41]|uniref:FAD-dependent monooxygenase n=1 Tax=Dyella sp. EPa41 TaxID=1561194 RepID=UPI0019165909|nr:FAD-dependent monooxygenase [Dyella sp. EPa41]